MMKRRFLYFALLLLLIGCGKSGTSVSPGTTTPTTPTTPSTPVETEPQQTVWHLKALSLDGVPAVLTPMQSVFRMTLYKNGNYADSDGASGVWNNPTSDSLAILKINLPTPITLRYKINMLTQTTLMLTRNKEAVQIDLTYEAD